VSVTHNFECEAHGVFEARVEPGDIPKCPRGCSPYFVHLVFVTPPSIGTDRVRTATRLVREAADLQGLSDIDVSPSTPGDSVADKNFKKSGNPIRPQAGPTLRWGPGAARVDIHALQRGNTITETGFGHKYDAHEWKRTESGRLRHSAPPPISDTPMNQYGVYMHRVKDENPRR
jgi:hypothetical protein